MPKFPPPSLQLPVLLFAEGGCQNNGTKYVPLLNEIASHGFLVITNGPPNGTGRTSPQYQRDNPPVGHLGIFNSDFLSSGKSNPNLPNGTVNEGPATIAEVHKPVFYFLGGPDSIAYPNVRNPQF
ncbi:uncharacterized protein PG998_004406 [Apiospora kogelbergensis]|uniref:uncharacterized protein n=1 Tax=Apiospora kogelbergensis TaxID=1337665 RepID=UPI003130393F